MDTIQRDPFIPPSTEKEIRENIEKMKVVTANELAKKYKIRVSSMKKLLQTLMEEGKIKVVSESSKLKVYQSTTL